MTLALILILLYVNIIRFQELQCYTTMFRIKEYFNIPTFLYNITIIGIWIGVCLIKLTK